MSESRCRHCISSRAVRPSGPRPTTNQYHYYNIISPWLSRRFGCCALITSTIIDRYSGAFNTHTICSRWLCAEMTWIIHTSIFVLSPHMVLRSMTRQWNTRIEMLCTVCAITPNLIQFNSHKVCMNNLSGAIGIHQQTRATRFKTVLLDKLKHEQHKLISIFFLYSHGGRWIVKVILNKKSKFC